MEVAVSNLNHIGLRHRHPFLQFFKPVQDDVDLGALCLAVYERRVDDHQELLPIGCHIEGGKTKCIAYVETSLKKQPGSARATVVPEGVSACEQRLLQRIFREEVRVCERSARLAMECLLSAHSTRGLQQVLSN